MRCTPAKALEVGNDVRLDGHLMKCLLDSEGIKCRSQFLPHLERIYFKDPNHTLNCEEEHVEQTSSKFEIQAL